MATQPRTGFVRAYDHVEARTAAPRNLRLPNGNLWRNRARSINMRARAFQAEGHLQPADLREIVRRDRSRCVYCNRTLDYETAGSNADSDASFDHVIRLADGGSNTPTNVVCACRRCNQRNASKSLADPTGAAMERLRWHLARKPRPPAAAVAQLAQATPKGETCLP